MGPYQSQSIDPLPNYVVISVVPELVCKCTQVWLTWDYALGKDWISRAQSFAHVCITLIVKRYHTVLAVTKRTKSSPQKWQISLVLLSYSFSSQCHFCAIFHWLELVILERVDDSRYPRYALCIVAFHKHIFQSQFDVRTIFPCKCALLAKLLVLEYAHADLHRIL